MQNPPESPADPAAWLAAQVALMCRPIDWSRVDMGKLQRNLEELADAGSGAALAKQRAEADRLAAPDRAFLREAFAAHEGESLVALTDAGPRVLVRGTMTSVVSPLAPGPEVKALIHVHPSGRLMPSDADMSYARKIGGVAGFAIADRAVTRLVWVCEPPTTGGEHA